MSGGEDPLAPRPRLFPVDRLSGQTTDDVTPKSGAAVGIIMRTKNRPLLLERAIKSVLAQTRSDWRLYLVNDGGAPAPLDALLARHEAALDGRLNRIDHAHSLGMEAASNAALVASTEPFIAVHDDDDQWAAAFLSETLRFLERPEAAGFAGVTTGCWRVTERLEADHAVEIERQSWPPNAGHVDMRKLIAFNQFSPISLMFRRRAVDLVGGFNVAMPVLGDWEFNLRLMLVGDIGYIDQPLAFYHVRTDGQAGNYGNSVVADLAEHEELNVRLRNAALRTALVDRPELIGLLQPILHSLHELQQGLDETRRSIEESRRMTLAMEQRILTELPRRASYQKDFDGFWQKMQTMTRPARHAWARYRGKGRA